VVQHDRHDCRFDDYRGIPRRALLGSLAGLGVVGALAPLATAEAKAASNTAAVRRIDVHHHFFPPAWLQHAEQRTPGPPPIMRDWSASGVLEHMDKTGVATAIASLSRGASRLPTPRNCQSWRGPAMTLPRK
jgi:hypothetical protein